MDMLANVEGLTRQVAIPRLAQRWDGPSLAYGFIRPLCLHRLTSTPAIGKCRCDRTWICISPGGVDRSGRTAPAVLAQRPGGLGQEWRAYRLGASAVTHDSRNSCGDMVLPAFQNVL